MEERKIYLVYEPDDYLCVYLVTTDKEQALALAKRYYGSGFYGIRVNEYVDGSEKLPVRLKLFGE